MKRSDMVVKMTEHWLGLFPGEFPGRMELDRELFNDVAGKMNGLLNMLEHYGMQPPVEEICPVIFKTQYVWEKEDA